MSLNELQQSLKTQSNLVILSHLIRHQEICRGMTLFPRTFSCVNIFCSVASAWLSCIMSLNIPLYFSFNLRTVLHYVFLYMCFESKWPQHHIQHPAFFLLTSPTFIVTHNTALRSSLFPSTFCNAIYCTA